MLGVPVPVICIKTRDNLRHPMKKIGFWLVKGIAFMISLTPFSLLYLRSDCYTFLLYHVIRYRRKVVRENLVKSFPEKSPAEIRSIEKRFYRNFCDLVVEICKIRNMKMEDLLKRVEYTNPELIVELYEKGKGLLLAMQHSGNWEWLWQTQATVSAHHHFAIYKKLENPYFDRYIFQLRTKHSKDQQVMIEDRKTKAVLESRQGMLDAVLILGDQSPRGAETDYWTDFLHRDTCWYTGIEKLARRFDDAVVYVEMNRVERGRYQVTFHLITEDPNSTKEGFIMEQYVRHVERFIQDQPDNWLWSHRRWKHSRQQAS